jgi:glycerol-3-phosphate dehydrogenase
MNRDEALRAALERPTLWDVLVIGGGASGLGAAVEAASRGYKTILLEQHDFAKGTSSRSTKLIHGGVRYLNQGNLPLVLDSLRERGRLLQNAPHLVHPLTFVIPTHHRWENLYYGFGLKLYDALAGRWSLGRSRLLSRDATVQALPTVATQQLAGGVRYFDGQFDDARLAICLAQTVFDRGGVAVNYARVTRLIKENGRMKGAVVQDQERGTEFELRARVVINATGVFTDSVRRLDDAGSLPLVTASQGAHVVVDRAFLPGASALMIPKTSDGRVLFAIPWLNHVVIGTTDQPVNQTPLEPRPLGSEIQFILETTARFLRSAPTRQDIRSAYAGLRPLVKSGTAKSTARLSRDHTIVVSPSGLVTLTGGKWTTYRKMGEDVIQQAAVVGNLEHRASLTRTMRLHGAPSNGAETQGSEMAGPPEHWSAYGTDAKELRQWAETHPAWNIPLHPRLPYRAVEVVWAARREMARSVEDVLARRTRVLFLEARLAVEMAPAVAALLQSELGRDEDWARQQVTSFTQMAQAYLVP